jgi:hypothetical protein
MLELIAALAILTIGIAGVLHAFSSAIAATKAAESYSTVSILANQVASQLDRDRTVEPGAYSGTFQDMDGYSWDANVEPADANGLMRTTITVSWEVDKNPRHFDMVICLNQPTNQDATTTDSSTSSSSTGGS